MLDNQTITQCSHALEMSRNNTEVDTVLDLEKGVRDFVDRKYEIDKKISAMFLKVSEMADEASKLATELEEEAAEVMANIQILRAFEVGYKDESSVFALKTFEDEVNDS
jgi:hypothetical protein